MYASGDITHGRAAYYRILYCELKCNSNKDNNYISIVFRVFKYLNIYSYFNIYLHYL